MIYFDIKHNNSYNEKYCLQTKCLLRAVWGIFTVRKLQVQFWLFCLLIWDSFKLFALVTTFFFCLFLSLNNSITGRPRPDPASRICLWCCCWLLILRMNLDLGWCWWRSLTCLRPLMTWWGWSLRNLMLRNHADWSRSHWSKDGPELPGRWSEPWDRTTTFSGEK